MFRWVRKFRSTAFANFIFTIRNESLPSSNQMEVIREYAKKLGFAIVKEYSDQGKSGLNMEGRESLGQLLQDVKEGRAEYSVILVYDVRR